MFIHNALDARMINVLDLTRDKDFKIYICGPTLYRKPHIGNLRTVLIANYIRNILLHKQYNVIIYSSITDIGHCHLNTEQDKVIHELQYSKHQTYYFLVDEFYQYYMRILDMLNITNITYIPASYLMEEYKAHIDKHLKTQNLYYDDNNNIRVQNDFINKNKHYLINQGKRLTSFTVWKQNKQGIGIYNQIHGNPGWHIECYSIIKKYFTYTCSYIDLHIGGIDLLDIHNNAEIIHCKLDDEKKLLSKAWLSVQQVKLNGKKMSKSSHNILYLEEVLEQYNISIITLMMFHTQYDNTINITYTLIKEVSVIYQKIINKIATYLFMNYSYPNLVWNKIQQFIYDNYNKIDITYSINTRNMIMEMYSKVYNHDAIFKTYNIDKTLNTQIFISFFSRLKVTAKFNYLITHVKNIKKQNNKSKTEIDNIKNYIRNAGYKIIENECNFFIY